VRIDRADGLAMTVATWFGCGRAPFAPGTFGSLGALAPAILLARAGWRPLYFVALAVAALPVAVWSADRTAKALGKRTRNWW
jgi:phosphatidylglycerophosphatase A